MCKICKSINLEVHAGHGLDYKTTKILKKLKKLLNIILDIL